MKAIQRWLGLWLALVMWASLPVQAQNPPGQFQGSPTQGSDELLSKIGIDQKLNAQIPLDLEFLDENGWRVPLRQYFDNKKPVILTPVYFECPSLCNLVLNGVLGSVMQLKENAGKDFTVLVVSFDPRETPELALGKKQAYLNRYGRPGTEDGWHFLTGSEANIQKLMTTVGFRYAWDEKQKQFAHASGIMMLSPQGKVSSYIYGVEYPPNMVRAQLQIAAANQVGKPAEQILLYCFHYDPGTGKYSLITVRVVQICGLFTILGIGIFLFVMFRQERQKRKLTEQRG